MGNKNIRVLKCCWSVRYSFGQYCSLFFSEGLTYERPSFIWDPMKKATLRWLRIELLWLDSGHAVYYYYTALHWLGSRWIIGVLPLRPDSSYRQYQWPRNACLFFPLHVLNLFHSTWFCYPVRQVTLWRRVFEPRPWSCRLEVLICIGLIFFSLWASDRSWRLEHDANLTLPGSWRYLASTCRAHPGTRAPDGRWGY